MSDLIERLRELDAKATPVPWLAEVDPTDDRDYTTLITMPNKAGAQGAWVARTEHNWNEAARGERRISWAEAQVNAALIVALRNEAIPRIAELEAENARLKARDYVSFTDGMEAAAEICASLAETTYDDADAFEAATGCEAAIMRVVKHQRKEQQDASEGEK